MFKPNYKSMLRMMSVATVLVVLALLLNPSAPQPACAAIACQGFAYNFTGTDPKSMTHYGIKADVNTKTPALCGGSHSDSSVWVMMAGGGSGQYAQVGYGRHQGQSSVYYFAQYKKNASTAAVHKETTVASGTHNYNVIYNFSNGHLYMYVDTTKILESNFDPAVSWTPGWQPQWEGETHDPGDDIPGSSSSPVYFSNMKIIATRGGPWVTPSGLTGSSTHSRYGFAWDTQNTKFHIWTK